MVYFLSPLVLIAFLFAIMVLLSRASEPNAVLLERQRYEHYPTQVALQATEITWLRATVMASGTPGPRCYTGTRSSGYNP